jgi:hypothetical protein
MRRVRHHHWGRASDASAGRVFPVVPTWAPAARNLLWWTCPACGWFLQSHLRPVSPRGSKDVIVLVRLVRQMPGSWFMFPAGVHEAPTGLPSDCRDARNLMSVQRILSS